MQASSYPENCLRTRLFKRSSDPPEILMAADRGEKTLISRLDLKAPFKTVDRGLSSSRLSKAFNLKGLTQS